MGRIDAESETLIPMTGCFFDGPTKSMGFAQNQRDEVRLMDISGVLVSQPGMKQQTYVMPAVMAQGVRRLTPYECELLQGFSGTHTLV